MEKTIRIWNGCKVVLLLSVSAAGGYSTMGAVGGAANSSRADIDLDPWAGLIVDHSTSNPPLAFRDIVD
jgi:hypothetical protein